MAEMYERGPRQGYEHSQTGASLCENCADGYAEQDREAYGNDGGQSLRPIVGHHPDLHCEGANCGMCINHEEGQECSTGTQSDNQAAAREVSKTIPAGSSATWTGVSGSTVEMPIGTDMTSKELGKHVGSYNWGSEKPAPGTFKVNTPPDRGSNTNRRPSI